MTPQAPSIPTDSSAPAVKLSLDDKLDAIMEAIMFQQKLILSSLRAMDTLLSNKSNLILPNK